MQNLTGSTIYVSPTPTLAVFQTGIDDYATALSAAKDRGKNNVAAKNARKKELVDLLVQLANYCMLTANSDTEALVASGFPLTKIRQPTPPLEAPVIKKMDSGANSGDLLVVIGKVKGSSGALFEYTADPITENSVWTGQNSTSCKTVLTGLVPGKRYWIRVTIFGYKKQSITCEPVLSKVIQ